MSTTRVQSSPAASFAARFDASLPAGASLLTKVVVAIAAGAFGFVLVMMTLSVLAPVSKQKDSAVGPRKISMPNVAPKPPPPKKKQRKAKAKKAREKAVAKAAPPRIGNALGKMDFGLPSAFADAAGVDVDKSLLGETKDVVMTEATVDELPKPVSRPAPQMPARARREGIEGRVLLRLSIDKRGRVTTAAVEQSTHPELFDAVAIAAAKRWRYAPARYRGDAVAISALQPIDFRLEGAR